MRVESISVDYGQSVRVELRGQVSEGDWERLRWMIGQEVDFVVKRPRRRWWRQLRKAGLPV